VGATRFLIFSLIKTSEWLLTGSVTQLVLAIISKDTRLPLERWVFDINLVDQPADSTEP
jgi:mitotic spindle assembly checkpoint protein MAD2